MVKYVVTIVLLLLFAVLAMMLPLRPGFKEIARAHMRFELRDFKTGKCTEHLIFIAADMVPGNAWATDDEFRLNHRLYDVLDIRYQSGKKFYRCLADDAEVTAEEKADELTQDLAVPSPSGQANRLAKSLADWLSHLFYEPAARYHQGLDCVFQKKQFVTASEFDLRDPFLHPAVRPPDTKG